MHDVLEQREAEKYRKAWNIKHYDRGSPGERMAQRFKRICKPHSGAYILDLGAGAGKGSKRLQEMGFRVSALDLVSEQFQHHGSIPFYHQPLWKPIPWAMDKRAIRRKWTYGYCCDVMEHIPPERVHEVLERIRDSCNRVFFSISQRPDQFGDIIDETLHLTVHPFEWWIEELRSVFSVVEEGRDIIVLGLYLCKS